MSLTTDIKYKLARLNILEKIIAVNVVVFLVGLILPRFLRWFELPSNAFTALVNPWTIVSYAFVHYEFLHLLFNMLWLYVIARMFLNLFSPKRALNIYFLGAISGGAMFLLGYALLPSFFGGNSSLVGASAAVRALLIFLCAYMPNQDVRVFMFNLKLWYIGVGLVVLDIVGLFGLNAGGNLAHLGGALLGYVYATQLVKGNDIGSGFERFVDAIANMFKASKKGPLKTVHKNKSKVGGYKKSDFSQFNNQKKIDIILDKISKSGYDSLTAEEKELLFRAGK
ncbi:rhomboid family protein [Algibacter lectus]|uniref:Membrane associated rhomboid family serine protease n=1 Tax=Algibacter lectus TaxID=221126 RepID=A0A4R8M3I6_9FLAO|nr:rhomboid family intramembrane serine protease [Algibacter lectus]MWW26533.1 rhomboid family intramembrane serine protease [Algibacter lectus]TDY59773.1 membrane associated rhomboid family serine protease [Algibacter lectus]